MILGEDGEADDYRLSFGDTELTPGVALTDTQVIPAYTHATSLLQVIGNGRLQPDKTAEALESVCGVVRSLSNGVTDVGELFFEASRSLDDSLAPLPAGSPQQNAVLDVGGSINDVFPATGSPDDPRGAPTPSGWADVPSPAALVKRLSARHPSHFAPEATETFVRNSMRDIGASGLGINPLDEPDFDQLMDPHGPTSAQPAISDIARVRRARRADGNDALLTIGNLSGNGSGNFVVPDIATQSAAAAASGFGSRQAVVAASGDSTWMDHVKTTWVSGLLHKSDTLDNTAEGKELRAQLDAIDVEQSQASGDRSDENESAPSGMDVDSEPCTRTDSRSQTQPRHSPSPTIGCTGWPSRGGSASPGLRRATKIAPSPVVAGLSGVASGLLRGGSAAVAQAMPALRHMPNRRGRKMKNPDMSAEERKRMRKEQKRRSARESRIRKKTMEEGYQQKLKVLISENGTLKSQVGQLTHKLQVLQGLLTVTVRPVNGGLPRPQPSMQRSVDAQNTGTQSFARDARGKTNAGRLDGNGVSQPGLQRSNRQGLFPMPAISETHR